MLERHALAVIDAGDPGAIVVLVDFEHNPGCAGVTSVLQQLADEDPRVGTVAVGLGPRPGLEIAGAAQTCPRTLGS